MRDWSGNSNSTFKPLGASNHTADEREPDDYYATEPKAAELLCELVHLSPNIWECACGGGHMADVFVQKGFNVTASDLVDRGYGDAGVDFLKCDKIFNGDIVTNPPYKFAQQFVEKALHLVPDGHVVAMFLKLTFLEGQKRKIFFKENPPKFVYVSSSRLLCAKHGNFQERISGGSAVAYAWYIWEKGFKGETTLKWFN